MQVVIDIPKELARQQVFTNVDLIQTIAPAYNVYSYFGIESDNDDLGIKSAHLREITETTDDVIIFFAEEYWAYGGYASGNITIPISLLERDLIDKTWMLEIFEKEKKDTEQRKKKEKEKKIEKLKQEIKDLNKQIKEEDK